MQLCLGCVRCVGCPGLAAAAPCRLSVIIAGGLLRAVTQISSLSSTLFLLLFLLVSPVHGLHPGQQQRQVYGQAWGVLVRVILGRIEALRLRHEIFGDVEIYEAIL